MFLTSVALCLKITHTEEILQVQEKCMYVVISYIGRYIRCTEDYL